MQLRRDLSLDTFCPVQQSEYLLEVQRIQGTFRRSQFSKSWLPLLHPVSLVLKIYYILILSFTPHDIFVNNTSLLLFCVRNRTTTYTYHNLNTKRTPSTMLPALNNITVSFVAFWGDVPTPQGGLSKEIVVSENGLSVKNLAVVQQIVAAVRIYVSV